MVNFFNTEYVGGVSIFTYTNEYDNIQQILDTRLSSYYNKSQTDFLLSDLCGNLTIYINDVCGNLNNLIDINTNNIIELSNNKVNRDGDTLNGDYIFNGNVSIDGSFSILGEGDTNIIDITNKLYSQFGVSTGFLNISSGGQTQFNYLNFRNDDNNYDRLYKNVCFFRGFLYNETDKLYLQAFREDITQENPVIFLELQLDPSSVSFGNINFLYSISTPAIKTSTLYVGGSFENRFLRHYTEEDFSRHTEIIGEIELSGNVYENGVLLSNTYAPLSHTHTTNDITNLSIYTGFTNYYTKTEVNDICGNLNDIIDINTNDIIELSNNKATIEDNPVNNRLVYWDNTDKQLKTDKIINVDNSNNVGIGTSPFNLSPYILDIRELENNDTRVMINDCSICQTTTNASLNIFIAENDTKEHIHLRRKFTNPNGTQIKDFGISVDEDGSLTMGKYDNNGNYEELIYISENHTIEVDGNENGDFVITGDNITLKNTYDGLTDLSTNLDTNYYTKTEVNDICSNITTYIDGEISDLSSNLNTLISNNATNISTNTTNISNNATNISTNTSNISNNATNISNNTSNISTNTTNISNNATDIATNTSAISTNTTNISNNASAISTNTTNISNNASAISTNTTNISNNTSNISTNTSNISANASAISTNTSNISTNATDIATNTSNISTNTTNISTNATDITNLTNNLSNNYYDKTTSDGRYARLASSNTFTNDLNTYQGRIRINGSVDNDIGYLTGSYYRCIRFKDRPELLTDSDNLFLGFNGGGAPDPDTRIRFSNNGCIAIGANFVSETTLPIDGLIVEGDMGIGKTDPSYNLDVNGDMNATTIYEGGTELTSKYAQLGTLNTFTGEITFKDIQKQVYTSNETNATHILYKNVASQSLPSSYISSVFKIDTEIPTPHPRMARVSIRGYGFSDATSFEVDVFFYGYYSPNEWVTNCWTVWKQNPTGQRLVVYVARRIDDDKYSIIIGPFNTNVASNGSVDSIEYIGGLASFYYNKLVVEEYEQMYSPDILDDYKNWSIGGFSETDWSNNQVNYDNFIFAEDRTEIGKQTIFDNDGINLIYSGTKALGRGPAINFEVNDLTTYPSRRGVGKAQIKALAENATSGNDSTAISFSTQVDDQTMAERMRITSGGNIGVGTTSPKEKLHCFGTTTNSIQNVALFSAGANGTSFAGARILIGGNGWTTYDNYPHSSAIVGEHESGGRTNLRFETCGSAQLIPTERMRITNSGRVGIGTTSPTCPLEVAGSIGITGNWVNPIFGSSGRGLFMGHFTEQSPSVGTIFAYDYNTATPMNLFLNRTGGFVGIRVSDPTSFLDVYSEIRSRDDITIQSDTTQTAISTYDSQHAFWINKRTGSDNWKKYMRVNEEGQISIGNDSLPVDEFKLNIDCDLGNEWFHCYGGTGRGSFSITTYSSSNYNIIHEIDNTGYSIGHDSSIRNINFRTNSLSRLTILGDGRVGIGTTSPERELEVYSSDNNTAIYISNGTNGGYSFIQYKCGGVEQFENGVNHTSANAPFWYIYSDRDSKYCMRVSRIGGIRFDQYTTNGTLSTTSSNGTIVVSSDRRLKKDIKYLDNSYNAIDELMKYKPCLFKWKNDDTRNETLGFIAQDLEEAGELSKYIVDGKKYEYEFKTEPIYREKKVIEKVELVDESGNIILDESGNAIYEEIEKTIMENTKETRILYDDSGNPLLDYDKPRYRGVSDRAIIAIQTLAIKQQQQTIQEQQREIKYLKDEIDKIKSILNI